eukprot:scaffold4590_cov112-Cylindrotheca_fusiformis.AAC.2
MQQRQQAKARATPEYTVNNCGETGQIGTLFLQLSCSGTKKQQSQRHTGIAFGYPPNVGGAQQQFIIA